MEKANDYKEKGNEFFRNNNFEEAAKCFSEAIQLDPSNQVLYSNRSACYVKMNLLKEALEDANKTISLKPDWPRGYSRKAAALHAMQIWPDAREAYTKGIELEPNNEQLKNGLAEVVQMIEAEEMVVQTSKVSNLLDEKHAFEERTKMPETDTKQIETNRREIQERLDSEVKSCIDKFSKPDDVLKFAREMNARKATDIVLQATDRCLELIQQLQASRTVFDLHNSTKCNIVTLALQRVLTDQEQLEETISKITADDKSALNVTREREAKTAQLEHVIKQCTTHLNNPSDLLQVAKTMSLNNEAGVVLELAPRVYQLLTELEQQRRAKDRVEQLLHMSKNNTSTLHENITGLQEILASMNVPPWLGNAGAHLELRTSFTRLVMSTTLTKNESLANKIAIDGQLSSERATYLKETIEAQEKRLIDLIVQFNEDPWYLIEVMRKLRLKKKFKEAIAVGNHCLSTLRELKQRAKEVDQWHKHSPQGTEKLSRDLELALHKLEPAYATRKVDEYDGHVVEISKVIFDACIDLRGRSNKNREAGSEQEKRDGNQLLHDEMIKSLDCIEFVDNKIALVDYVFYKPEHSLVLALGVKIEDKLEEMRKVLVKQADVKKELDKLNNANEEIEALGSVNYDLNTLHKWMLAITNFTIKSAESLEDKRVLCQQLILAFKAGSVSFERWNKIHDLCPEEEWSRLKTELANLMISSHPYRNEELVQLFIKDGLYEECTRVFPAPSSRAGEMAMLLSVWKSIENYKPELLERTMPHVTKYVEYYGKDFRFEEFTELVDHVQQRFPEAIGKLYLAALGAGSSRISRSSQYGAVINCVCSVHVRLRGTLNKVEDWTAFFEEFQKIYQDKQKMMQRLVNRLKKQLGEMEHERKVGQKEKRTPIAEANAESEEKEDKEEIDAEEIDEDKDDTESRPKKKHKATK